MMMIRSVRGVYVASWFVSFSLQNTEHFAMLGLGDIVSYSHDMTITT